MRSPVVGSRVVVVSTAGCPHWIHDATPPLNGVRGTVREIWPPAPSVYRGPPGVPGHLPTYEDPLTLERETGQHPYFVVFDRPPPLSEDAEHRLIGTSFSAAEISIVAREAS